jgi:signal transduction histidine kinase
MKRLSAVPAILLFAALLTWISERAINTNAAIFDRALEALDRLAATEAALHRDVLAVRAGVLRNYDPLVHDTDALDASLEELHRAASFDSATATVIDRLGSEIAAQEEVVEQFKTNEALLRNSLAYFGQFCSRLNPTGSSQPVIPAVGALATAMLRLTLDTSPENTQAVADRLDDLAADRAPAEDADRIQILLKHGRLLQTLLPATDALVKELCSTPRKQDQATVRSMVLARLQVSRETRRGFRIALYAFSLLLLAALLYLGWRLRARNLAMRRQAALEHVIAGISIRLIDAPSQEIEGQIDAAIADLARCIGADRAYCLFGAPVDLRHLWHRDGMPFPPGWPDAVPLMAAKFGVVQDGLVQIPDVRRHPCRDERRLLACYGLSGWACVACTCALGTAVYLGFDAVGERCHITAPGELSLLRMALDAIVNAAARRRIERERDRLESRLQHAQRMETIGAFASGIAHNFNNIVGAILGYAEMAENRLAAGTAAARNVEEIRRAGERARVLAEQILTFGRTREIRRESVAIAELVGEAASLLRVSLPPAIELAVPVVDESIVTWGDPAQLQQIVLNLCTNAARAMEERGRITVGVAVEQVVWPRPLSHGHLALGRYVCLSIADNGCGIDEVTIERIFEPFFTTRPEGNGLGLATVREVVREHGGAMNVISTPGVGSRFEAWLPCLSAAVAATRDQAESSLGQGETILVVNNDAVQLLRDEEVLAALCYEPVGFTEPDAALAAYQKTPTRFDAFVIGRLGPPGAVLKLAAALPSELPILLATPSAGSFDADFLAAAGISDVVHAPVVASEIAEALGRLFIKHRAYSSAALPP